MTGKLCDVASSGACARARVIDSCLLHSSLRWDAWCYAALSAGEINYSCDCRN
ncbi:MAG: hypothetical protein GY820_30770 [Gammaproteobacteria bacterium]|nr:hypothetical protein [Gammaproteobacteria bacterium]